MLLKEFIQKIRIVRAERKITWNERWWHDGIDMENCFVNKDTGYLSVCHNFQECKKAHCKSYPAYLKYEYQLSRMNEIKKGKTGNWFLYLVKTPIVQMRSDWMEYKKLGSQLRCAGIYKGNMYRRISKRFLNPDSVVLNDYCIVDYNGRDDKGNLEHRQYKCPSFVNEANCGKCNISKRKSEYDAACIEYEKLKLKKSVFWQEKFARVK